MGLSKNEVALICGYKTLSPKIFSQRSLRWGAFGFSHMVTNPELQKAIPFKLSGILEENFKRLFVRFVRYEESRRRRILTTKRSKLTL